MRAQRAYSYVDRAATVVGNRWCERKWSAFLGETISLTQKDTDFDWVAGACAEFSLSVEGDVLSVMDFGDLDWSEENSDLGAALAITRRRPGLELRIRTVALHDNPGMWRSTMVLNTGPSPLQVSNAIIESLSVHTQGLHMRMKSLAASSGTPPTELEVISLAVLTLPERGIVVGSAPGGRLQCDTKAGCCTVVAEGAHMLAPGEGQQLPDTFLMFFTGDFTLAVESAWRDLRRRIRDAERRSAWQRAEASRR